MKRIAALALLTMSTGAALALAAGPASAAGHHGYDGYYGYCADRHDSMVMPQSHYDDCDRAYSDYMPERGHTLPMAGATGEGYYGYY
ncbi:hypothetical protein [Nocardiopsis sp. YSL2]|uniref:hypothetical protein n=1 Tax=Nocardiopsis sp. YSL2 TaxID=2939492 RepID=UPI0026F42291|nr:hypothetical protein [Nocardiopsis sp. YSL2]